MATISKVVANAAKSAAASAKSRSAAKSNYEIDYNDKRFVDVEADKNAAIKNSDKTYDGMINQSDKYFQDQIDASKDWAEKQSDLQNEKTDFAIEQIEQQKDQAHKDYIKEQSGAYVDWQKQSGKYGVNAEQEAAQGMANTGFSESSQVSMYNTYQNRVVAARESYNRAVLNYDNAIKDARLQNNSMLAEIAYNALQKQLELSLQGFQYKNQLVLEKANKRTELDQMYYGRYQDVLKQINTENALAEQIRQYNETLAENKRQYNATLAENKRQHNASLALQREQFEWQKAKASGSGSSGGGSSGGSSSINKSSSGKPTVEYYKNLNYTGVKEAKKVTTYSQACAVLNKYGVEGDGGLMTATEWARRKNSGSNKAETAYSTYKEYLQNFVTYKIQYKK